MIDIPYRFKGSVEYQSYSEIVRRIEKLNHEVIGTDESGRYDLYIVESGSRRNPTIFLMSSLHGTEFYTTDYGLTFFEMLRDNTFPDKEFRKDLLENYHLVYVPVANPWGVDNNSDIYRQFNNPARNNVNGVDLNRDFFDFSQKESRIVAEQIQRFKPFSFVDMHMFQPDYDDNKLIIANSEVETEYIRDMIVDTITDYSGKEMTVWRNTTNPDPESGLARRYAYRQNNPYTPHTLAFITEIVRPARVSGNMVKRLSEDEIYSIGMAEIYAFINASIMYLREHWEPAKSDPVSKSDQSIVVRNQKMEKIGVLEKAYNISIERRANELWKASFSLTENDVKRHLCQHMHYIDITSPNGRYMGLYRIMPTMTKRNVRERSITYKCEHVLATLMDDVIDGQLVLTHLSTRLNLQEILDLQTVEHWVLGDVEFDRQFNYKFENENGLLAPVLEIPKGFNEHYEFTFDTTVYPWELNLIRPSDKVTSSIRWGKDMISFEEVSDPSNIVNYIIPKGAGEGINQLTIEGVNNGVNYLKDDESIKKWGIHKYIWIDRRYEDPQSLKDTAQAKLDQWKDPQISFECPATDLSVKPEYSHERRLLNGVTNITVDDKEYKARIIAEKIPDLNKEWDVDYEINNKLGDVTTTQTDMEKRQQVNESYSQGATNILTFGYQDNADENIPAVIPFYIDDDVVNVNTCELTFRTKPYRAYSRATEGGGSIATTTGGGGGIITSTLGGGGSEQTSSSGGGTSRSTNSGGGSSQTSGLANGWETTIMPRETQKPFYNQNTPFEEHIHFFNLDLADWDHWHTVNIPAHSHDFEVPSHTHKVEIPNHTHEIELKNHTHRIEIPNHTHEVRHEIIELNELPTSVRIRVDGNTVPHTSIRGDRIDLSNYIDKDSNGRIKRGRHELTILPDRKGRIEADLILRVFIQSQLGRAM